MGVRIAFTLCRNKDIGGELKAFSAAQENYPADLLGGYVMYKLIIGLVLAILLMPTMLTSAQDSTNTSVSESSAQAITDGGGTVPAETTGNQEATYGAEEMDQMIQTIEGDSNSISGAEEAAVCSEIVDGTADTAENCQPVNAPKGDSSSTTEDGQASDTVKEAEEMDQMIQSLTVDNGSTNAEADQSAGATGADSVMATDQSVSVGTSSDEEGGNLSAGADQDSGTINQTNSIDQMIQTLVESDGNNASETSITQGIESINGTETAVPAEQPIQQIQMTANGEVTSGAETTDANQTEIQEKTESMGLLIQTLANNETSTGVATAKSTETIETTDKTKSIDQAIQTLENYSDGAGEDETMGSNEVASAQDIEIAAEENSIDNMIQALEGSDIQQE